MSATSNDPAEADPTGDSRDSAELVQRAATGDGGAFRALVRKYHTTIYRWAVASLGDQDEAEDVCQHVLMKTHESLGAYRGDSLFTTWLYRITRNVLAERARAQHRRLRLLSDESELAPNDAQSFDVVATLDRAKLTTVVRELLASLPPRQREVFALADLDGFSQTEIAAMTGLEAVTVRTNLLKARRAVRTRMLREQWKLLEELKQ